MHRLVVVAAALLALLTGCTSTHATQRRTPAGAQASSESAPPTSAPSSTPTHPRTAKGTPIGPKTAQPSAPPATTHPSASLPPVTFPPGSGPLIALNPGHNGANASHPAEISRLVPSDRYGHTKACDTTGTSTDAGYSEHEFNWDVTLRVRALLQARGVRVILTRPDDAGVGPCVDERAAIGNQPGVVAVISIHADGAASDGHGFHVCEDSQPPAGAAVAAQSHRLSVAVHDALLGGSGLTTSTYLGSAGYFPRSDLAGLNLATVPATFLELGNMRNGGDAALQSSPAGRQRVAVAVAAGILAYLGR
ncbi:MAG: N-acetylmuramoyl-L-alanine amidase [Jatrophihabitantaceae bacterium]